MEMTPLQWGGTTKGAKNTKYRLSFQIVCQHGGWVKSDEFGFCKGFNRGLRGKRGPSYGE